MTDDKGYVHWAWDKEKTACGHLLTHVDHSAWLNAVTCGTCLRWSLQPRPCALCGEPATIGSNRRVVRFSESGSLAHYDCVIKQPSFIPARAEPKFEQPTFSEPEYAPGCTDDDIDEYESPQQDDWTPPPARLRKLPGRGGVWLDPTEVVVVRRDDTYLSLSLRNGTTERVYLGDNNEHLSELFALLGMEEEQR